MKTFDNLTEALNDLRINGYDLDFDLNNSLLSCPQLARDFSPEKFDVDRIYRFKGENDLSDSSILYGISTTECNMGILVDAYGAYSPSIDEAILEKLAMDRDTSY